MRWGIIIAGLIALAALGVSQFPQTFIKPSNMISPVPITTVYPTPTPILPTPTAGPSATPAPTLTPRPTSKPTPTKTPEPTPTPTLTADSSDVYGLTEKFAAAYGIDANKLRHIAQCESGFNPNSKHLIYGGLYQFSGATWKTYRTLMNLNPDPDLRFNATEAIRTAAYIYSINHQSIWPNCLP